MPSDRVQGSMPSGGTLGDIMGNTPGLDINTPFFRISREDHKKEFYESYKRFGKQAMVLLNRDMKESEPQKVAAHQSIVSDPMDALCTDLVADKDKDLLRWSLDPAVQEVIDHVVT